MAAAEQNGIDILCDAAGSDMLLSSLFALAAPGQDQQRAQPQDQHELQHTLPTASPTKQPHQQQAYHQQLDPALQPSQQETPRKTPSSLPAKRKLSDASASSPSHVCHICRRVYERADHLTRHLRSHENARPYQCSRCPKRFNRADLLTRHETTHDRDGAAKDRPFIRRNDRAAEACLNCAASKAKCEDQKPCSRCRNKSLTCQMPARRGNQYRTSESQAGVSPSDSSMVASTTGNDNQVFTAGDAAYALSQSAVAHQVQSIDSTAGYAGSSFLGAPSVEAAPDETLYFAAPRKLLPDIELSWDMDFGNLTFPTSDANGPIHRLGNGTKRSSRQPRRDMPQEDTGPQLSAWVAKPAANGQAAASTVPLKTMLPIIRDGLFAMVLADGTTKPQVPTFPSADTLSYLIETFFIQQDQKQDDFIHKASFDTSAATLELVSAIVSTGAMRTSAPTAWQFGLALNDVLKTALNNHLESFGTAANPLMLLQASMLHLDIAQWCGYNRQMEMAQTFAQQVLTLVRGTGRISFSSESTLYIPSAGDSSEVLESKWRDFARIESHKRLMMRLFIHDVQSSIVLWKSSNMAYSELDFTLPAAPDLWKAASSQQWRDLYSAKRSTTTDIPHPLDIGDCVSFITEPNDHVDIELCCMATLSGLWGQIWIYRDAVTYRSNPNRRSAGSPAWIEALYQDLYSKLVGFSNQAQGMQSPSPELLLFSELLMVALHVSFDQLHQLAGQNGEGGSRRAAQILEATWFSGPESRHAVWHAGQLLRYAQDCKATSLQGFNSMAVYFAGLTLWAYGIMSAPGSSTGEGIADDYVLLNAQETRESRAFLELGQGTPSLALPAGLRLQIEPLSNRDMALSLARNILRQNFPVLNETLPPMVENLWRRLAELQSGQNGQAMTDTDGTVVGAGNRHV
ncbi:hypothetical protein CEP52_000558 [Fusarium oligoseptatum]|uniref:Uncharacterized protein n=1 Tax=Fusarium oligoseptatum TaxID=2604345 RepID=A0A428UNS3_9HYPO|nr:hypothetical protein CEP52_000558 [Fusarium oligoseptatum]